MPISQNGWSLRKTSNSKTTLGWLVGAIDGGVQEGVIPQKSLTFLQVIALTINHQFAGTAAVAKNLHVQRQVIPPYPFERTFVGP